MNWKTLWNELAQYPSGVLEEARKVDWPTRHETFRLTVVAVAIIALATLYVGVIDVILSRADQFLLQ